MSIQVFGNQGTAIELFLAFNGVAPSNPIFTNLTSTIGSGTPLALATAMGNATAAISSTTLAASVLANVGINTTTVNATAFTTLQTALGQAFDAFGVGSRGQIVLNLVNLLINLEGNATYGSAAAVFNNTVASAFIFASNTDNTQTQTVGSGITLPLSVNAGDIVNGTAGNDTINGNLFFNAPSGTFFQVLQSGDSINGGAGFDTLNLGINLAANLVPLALTSIEAINFTNVAPGAVTVDMVNASGTTAFTSNSSTAATTFSNLSTLVQSLSLNAQAGGGGVTLTHTAATVAGTADVLALNLNNATGSAAVSVAGYETINLASNGTIVNSVALTDANATTLNVTGAIGVAVTSGNANMVNINASGMTGTGATGGLSFTTTATSNLNATGSGANDTFTLGGTYTNQDTISAGAGTDTFSVTTATVAGIAANQSNLSGFEVLSLSDAITTATYTPASWGGATGLTLAAASASDFTVNYAAGAAQLTFGAAETGAKTLNSTGSAITDSLALAAGGFTSTGTLTTNGFETLTVNSNGTAANTLGAVTMTNTAATEALVITGAQNLTLGVVTADSINASALTGSLVMVTGTVSGSGGGMAITGGTNNDTLFGSAFADVIQGGTGNDRIVTAAGADLVTLGAGADQYVLNTGAAANLFVNSIATTAEMDTITDFVAGTDKVVLLNATTAITSVTVTAVTVATAADVATLLTAIGTTVAASAGATESVGLITVSAGLMAGTYLLINDGTNTAAATDNLINITGVTGTVTATDFAFA